MGADREPGAPPPAGAAPAPPTLRQRAAFSLGSLIAAAWIVLLRVTLRFRWTGREHARRIAESGEACLLAFWHEHLMIMRWGTPRMPSTALVSRHRDGEWIARTLARLGVDLTRGSTTRGGAIGLREIVRKVRDGFVAGFAVDGPKGPRRIVQPGVVQAARLTGAPILPVSFACSRGRRLSSWDRFLIPGAFGRAAFHYGLPIRIGRRAGRDELEAARVLLEEELLRLTERAETEVGGIPG
jgi:lysophospholipid acyltransferase (LPLAT)-like uncharacterized protein